MGGGYAEGSMIAVIAVDAVHTSSCQSNGLSNVHSDCCAGNEEVKRRNFASPNQQSPALSFRVHF